MSMEYIRKRYQVAAKRGMRVVADGKPGVITGSVGSYLRIRLDGEKTSGRWHPTWRIEYGRLTAEQAVIEAAKAWAKTRLTRTDSGLRDALIQAVEVLEKQNKGAKQ